MEYRIWHNENGPDIGCGPSRGVIEQDGLFFRNLEGTGELLPYEDWRLTPEERAKDLADRLTVEEIAGLMLYSPHQRVPAPSDGPFPGFYGGKGYAESGAAPYELDPMQGAALPEGFVRVDTPEEADAAVVFLESPKSECYDRNRDEPGGNGYFPISLQYRPYQAEKARKVSIAGGDFREESDNRSYQGKSAVIYNEADLDNVVRTKEQMGNKPVIAVIRMHNPAVLSELEPFADAILCEFGVQKRAVFDLISGKEEPSGLLPIQLPADMDTVEMHCEDVPMNMVPYTDSCGNTYDYGFGMNWSGVIRDGRAEKYRWKEKKD